MERKHVFIRSGLRSAIGKKGGIWRQTIPEDLAASLTKVLARKYQPDDLLLATSLGTGGNMARYVALQAGLGYQVPASTIDTQCVGSIKTLQVGIAQMMAAQNQCVFVGGMESNSLAPTRNYHINDPRYVAALNHYEIAQFAPPSQHVSLLDAAEKIAQEMGISSVQMSDWAYQSHQKAINAWEKGYLSEIILPINGIERDETLPPHRTYECWAKLTARQTKVVNATNTADKHDGACVLALGITNAVDEMNECCEIVAIQQVAVEPNRAPIAFLKAIELLLSKNKLALQEIDYWEINESFALKPLVLNKKYRISSEKINIFGGNLAFGHPFGASGALGVLHLTKVLQVTGGKWGVFAMSAAGGIGMAVLLRNR